MKLSVNGEELSFGSGRLSVSGLLKDRSVRSPEMVSVELNGEILSSDQYDKTFVGDGDQVEFLYFMGGGA